MSKLNIKQIAGPAAGGRSGTGAIPVFDGNLIRWSNAATTALQLPSGTTAQRPTGIDAVDGAFRYNSELGKIEARQAGSWVNAVSDIKSFLDLSDAPKTYTAGKVLAVNAAGTGIEYIDPTVTVAKITDGPGAPTLANAGKYITVKSDGSGLQYAPFPALDRIKSYRFRVAFTGTNPAVGGFSELPAGWTVSISNTADLVVTHNMGLMPQGGMVLGLVTQPDTYRNRFIGNNNMDMRYSLSDLNTLTVTQVTNTNCGAISGTHAYVYVWFLQ